MHFMKYIGNIKKGKRMRKTLKWVATENNLFTLINKDAYAIVEENKYSELM